MKKYAITAITAAICTAASTISYGAVFSDIGSNLKWAESYINSVYESGLMVGDYNSKNQRVFRGSENMTYSEAAQLIYSIVLKSNFSGDVTDAGINRYSMEMTNEGVAEWAKRGIAFCMEKGIVSSYDLTKFIEGGNDIKITREDMVVFLGRALALNYSISTGTSLAFNDTSSITAAAKPYVELLNKLGIVSGDNNNNFNPKSNITRAEVAVLASKAYDLMKKNVVSNPESGYTQTSGTVVSLLETNGTWVLRLTTPDGVSGFVLTGSTPVYNNASSNVGPAGLGLGDSVTIYHSDAAIAKVIITKDVEVNANNVNTPQYSSTIKNKGELISAGDYKIGIKDKHDDKTYYTVAEDAKITLNGRSATLRQLSDRMRGDAVVEVTVELNSSTQEAYLVEAVEEKYTSNTEGKIKNINDRQITIESGSKTYKYSLVDDVSVKYNGSSTNISSLVNKFDDLTGSRYIDVKLTLDKNKDVEKIVAEASNYKEDDDKSYTGDIKDIDEKEIKIGSKTYKLSDSIDVDITAGSDSIDDIDDLIDAFNGGDVTIRVEISLKDSKVKKIDGYISELEGEVDFMNITNESRPRGEIAITVDGIGQIEFKFDEDTTIRIDGTSYDSENIKSLKNSIKNTDVKVKFDEDGLATSVKD